MVYIDKSKYVLMSNENNAHEILGGNSKRPPGTISQGELKPVSLT